MKPESAKITGINDFIVDDKIGEGAYSNVIKVRRK